MRFSDKVVLITGAARGIGECAARNFAKEGGMVALTDIMTSLVKQVSDSVNSVQGQSIYFGLDIANPKEVDMVVKECVNKFRKIDIFVHCAAIYKEAPFLSMTEQQWDETININLKGTFLCCQSVAREMVKKKSGKIVCLSSLAGQRGATPPYSHYGASKAGVLGLCKSLARELIPFGINVNCIAPGTVSTDMTKNIREKMGEDFKKAIPIGRFATVQDIANAILFLSSNESDYITGSTIDVNGGWLMR
jgi:3-oxoacyl-[acyl-carrier protein] reductase